MSTEKIAHMVKGKIHKKLLALFLVLGLFSSGMMAEACICGQSCPHGLQKDSSGASVNSLFHKRCSETNCKSCNLENGQTLKAANISSSDGNFKIFDRAWILSVSLDYPTTNHYLMTFCSTYTSERVLYPPIYIKNLSFLF